MDPIAALPEDAQLLIFSRVGNIRDLFMLAMTCKWWVHCFTDPAFLCNVFFKGNRASLIGFFFQKTKFKFIKPMMELRSMESASVSAPTFMLSPLSPLIGPAERSFTAFIPDHDGTFNYAEPLGAHHGIILLQLVPRTFDCPKTPVLLNLCNPITGECHFLTPLETPGLQVTMNAIITADDSCNVNRGQLLLVTTDPTSQVYLHSYSIDTRSWSTPTRWLEASRYCLVGDRAAVIHCGAAHWLCTDRKTMQSTHQDDGNLYKLSVEVGTLCVSIMKLPFYAVGSQLLCVSKDNKLSVTCVHVMHVTIWTQQECGEEGDGTPAPWLRTAIRITPDPNYFPRSQHGTYRHWFRLNNGSLVLLNKYFPGNSIFILDLEKKVMEEVKHSFLRERTIKGNLPSVLYEMDLVKFFVHRLGGLRVRDNN